jgi:hypothetical protein
MSGTDRKYCNYPHFSLLFNIGILIPGSERTSTGICGSTFDISALRKRLHTAFSGRKPGTISTPENSGTVLSAITLTSTKLSGFLQFTINYLFISDHYIPAHRLR